MDQIEKPGTQSQSNIQLDDPLLIVGKQRMQNMMANMVPQVALTLISVVQGVVLASLVGALPTAWKAGFQDIAYSFASFLVIVAFWHAFISATIMLKWTWPLKSLETTLYFVVALVENINILLISNHKWWLATVAVLCFLFSFLSWRSLISIKSSHFGQDLKPLETAIRAHQKRGVRGFIVLGICNVVLAVATYFYPAPWFAVLALLPITFATILAMTETEKSNRHQLNLAGLSAEFD